MRSVATGLSTLVLLAGCTIPGGSGSSGATNKPGAAATTVALQEGPAPSGVKNLLAVRANEVTRAGTTVLLGLTVATASDSLNLSKFGITITTNSGVKIPADFETRALPEDSSVALALSVPLPERRYRR